MGGVIFDGISYETEHVAVPGGNVATYSIGSGPEALLLVHGGPGMSCDYLRESHARLAGDRYRVVAYDQLGSGASDRPDDPALWTIGRFVEELEAVRIALGLSKVHLLGQSWGSFLAIEYALTRPDRIKTLIVCDGAADMPQLSGEMERLRSALGVDTVTMMHRHEAEGTFDHPEYRGAMDVLTWRHVCRLQDWPPALLRSVSNVNAQVAGTIVGPNDYVFRGNLRHWNRMPDLGRITQPALVLCGLHDELTPTCARRVHEALPDSRIKVFQNSSHTPFLEEPEEYFGVLQAFLDEKTGVKV